MLCVPVRCGGHTVGLVVMHSKEPFSQAEKAFVQRVFDMFGNFFQRDLTALALSHEQQVAERRNAIKGAKSKTPPRKGAHTSNEAKQSPAYKTWHQLVVRSQLGIAEGCALVAKTFMSSLDVIRAERAANRLQAMQRARRVRLQVPQRRVLVQKYGAKAASRVLDALQQWHNIVDDTEELSEILISKIVPFFDAAKEQWTAAAEVTITLDV